MTTEDIKCLIGMTMARVDSTHDELIFTTVEGRRFKLYHSQDCCETVTIESIVGNLEDLVGEPLVVAEESTSNEHPNGYTPNGYEESFTWTFYKFATRKGYVDVRWLGESNGYYSEAVDFCEVLQ